MFIDKSLEERPKPVRLVYDAGESGVVAQEVLHFLDGALVRGVVAPQPLQFQIVRVLLDCGSLLAFGEL